MNGKNLREEVLRFNSFPIPDPMNGEHYMAPAAALEHIESNNLSFEEMKKIIPSTKLDKNGEDLKKRRKKDKQRDFHPTKVRGAAKCTACGAFPCLLLQEYDRQTGRTNSRGSSDS